MPKNWAKGLTKDTDERVARAARAHFGLIYKRRQIKRNNFAWSSKLAYAVGLITTDGNLSKDGRHLEFTSKDKKLVRTFKSILHLNNKISKKGSGSTNGKKYFRIQFGNIGFYNWLTNIGLTPAKSKTLGQLLIPDRYFFDFLRGCFDGDGCIRSYWDKRWASSFMFYTEFCSASIEYLNWLRAKLAKLLGVQGAMKTNTRSFALSYAKTESLKLLPKLYYNDTIPYLSRKRRKVERILNENQAEVEKLENSQP